MENGAAFPNGLQDQGMRTDPTLLEVRPQFSHFLLQATAEKVAFPSPEATGGAQHSPLPT
jgi:hypothetical protein